jgi:putative ABC transport system permease protein
MIGPIVRALRHRPAFAVLIVLEVGFGFAVSVQAFVMGRWFDRVLEDPSGISDDTFAVCAESGLPAPPHGELAAARARDLAALGALPGVAGVAAVARVPMGRATFPNACHADGATIACWTVDGAATRATLGVKLIAGRDLEPADASASPTPVLLDESAAEALYPGASAIGQGLEVRGRPTPAVVVGVTADFRAVSDFAPFARQTLIIPDEPIDARSQAYLVRTTPGRLAEPLRAAPAALLAAEPARAVEATSLLELRARMDRSGHGGVAIFAFMVVIVVLVVLSGTFGMVAFLVTERTKQIGTRRALGATRRQVVAHFLVENWLLTSLGVLAGLPLTYALNAVARLAQPDLAIEWPPLVLGVLLFWLAGDLAALVPALRAASIPPTVASKTV